MTGMSGLCAVQNVVNHGGKAEEMKEASILSRHYGLGTWRVTQVTKLNWLALISREQKSNNIGFHKLSIGALVNFVIPISPLNSPYANRFPI
jgi:hypothetical protein